MADMGLTIIRSFVVWVAFDWIEFSILSKNPRNDEAADQTPGAVGRDAG